MYVAGSIIFHWELSSSGVSMYNCIWEELFYVTQTHTFQIINICSQILSKLFHETTNDWSYYFYFWNCKYRVGSEVINRKPTCHKSPLTQAFWNLYRIYTNFKFVLWFCFCLFIYFFLSFSRSLNFLLFDVCDGIHGLPEEAYFVFLKHG